MIPPWRFLQLRWLYTNRCMKGKLSNKGKMKFLVKGTNISLDMNNVYVKKIVEKVKLSSIKKYKDGSVSNRHQVQKQMLSGNDEFEPCKNDNLSLNGSCDSDYLTDRDHETLASELVQNLNQMNELRDNICHKDVKETIDYIDNYNLIFDKHMSEKTNPLKTIVEDMNISSIPSVTTILNETKSEKSKIVLHNWERRMIEEMGREGFQKHKKETFKLGSNYHDCVNKYLQKKDYELLPENTGHWKSVQHVLKNVGQLQASEVFVYHDGLFYQGKFDCICYYKNTLCLIDWKTSQKIKPFLSNTYDNPLQIAAYLGAVNNNPTRHDIAKAGMIRQGALVIAYADGHPADVHVMDLNTCEKYWKLWKERLQIYWKTQIENHIKNS